MAAFVTRFRTDLKAPRYAVDEDERKLRRDGAAVFEIGEDYATPDQALRLLARIADLLNQHGED